MAREVIGKMACPECGSEAEVKRTKAGLAYRWCTECNAQYFPRTAEASDRLIAKCEAGTETDKRTVADLAKDLRKAGYTTASAVHEDKPKAKATPPEPPKAEPTPAPKPAKPRSAFDDALALLGGRA